MLNNIKERIQLIADTEGRENKIHLLFDLIHDIKETLGDDLNEYRNCIKLLDDLASSTNESNDFKRECIDVMIHLEEELPSVIFHRDIKLVRHAIGHTDKDMDMDWKHWQPEVNIYMYEDGVIVAQDHNYDKVYYSLEEFEADEWTILRDEEIIKLDVDLMAILIDDDRYWEAEDIYEDAIEFIKTEDDLRECMHMLLKEYTRNIQYYYKHDCYFYFRDKADMIAEAYYMLDELLKETK